MAHFGNHKPTQKMASPSTTNTYKRVPSLLGHQFCLIPFLVMERGIHKESKLSTGAHCPYFVFRTSMVPPFTIGLNGGHGSMIVHNWTKSGHVCS